jgi:uncharacterized protein (DUF58 family)
MAGGMIVFLFVLSYFLPIYLWALLALIVLPFLLLADIILLYRRQDAVFASRTHASRLSNGDQNPIRIFVQNRLPFRIHVSIAEELPAELQIRNLKLKTSLLPGETRELVYHLRPVQRGEYDFGNIRVFTESPLGIILRRVDCGTAVKVPVYPSYVQLKKYELHALDSKLNIQGIKKIRKIGHTMEFEKIDDYVPGDEYRTINWKSTAKHSRLMVNRYIDERAQQIYSVIDLGRVMKMPFEGLTLLDYAINSSLVLSNVVIRKGDKAGLITYACKPDAHIRAERKNNQMLQILNQLYRQQTGFLESDPEALAVHIRREVNQRSLIMLYTNFESLLSLERQLPALRAISRNHLLVVVFFQNTELKAYLEKPAVTVDQIYRKTIAEKFELEKKQMIRVLRLHGIQAVYTSPANLTVNTLNKYLELKSRGLV